MTLSSPFPLFLVLLIVICWIFPVTMVALSPRVTGGGKVVWVIACVVFPLVAPLIFLATQRRRRPLEN